MYCTYAALVATPICCSAQTLEWQGSLSDTFQCHFVQMRIGVLPHRPGRGIHFPAGLPPWETSFFYSFSRSTAFQISSHPQNNNSTKCHHMQSYLEINAEHFNTLTHGALSEETAHSTVYLHFNQRRQISEVTIRPWSVDLQHGGSTGAIEKAPIGKKQDPTFFFILPPYCISLEPLGPQKQFTYQNLQHFTRDTDKKIC